MSERIETAYGPLTIATTPDVQHNQQAGTIVAYTGSGYSKGMIVVRGTSEKFAASFVVSDDPHTGVPVAVESVVKRLRENGYTGSIVCR